MFSILTAAATTTKFSCVLLQTDDDGVVVVAAALCRLSLLSFFLVVSTLGKFPRRRVYCTRTRAPTRPKFRKTVLVESRRRTPVSNPTTEAVSLLSLHRLKRCECVLSEAADFFIRKFLKLRFQQVLCFGHTGDIKSAKFFSFASTRTHVKQRARAFV